MTIQKQADLASMSLEQLRAYYRKLTAVILPQTRYNMARKRKTLQSISRVEKEMIARRSATKRAE